MSKIISIHSFRGGTGKSNLTANLAANVVAEGKRVAIVDSDLQSPGIHILFGIEQDHMQPTLNDFLFGNCSIKEVAHDVTDWLKQTGTIIQPEGQLYLLPSSIKAGDIARILREGYKATILNDGLLELIEILQLDYLFIDTHPGLNDETLLSIAISDLLILILRPDAQDFQGTAVTVEVARKLDVADLLLVVNKALPNNDFEKLKQKVTQTYKAPVATVLPLAVEIAQMGSNGLFSLHTPDHYYSEGVRGIAARIMA